MDPVEIKRVLVAIKPWQRGLPLAAGHARALAQSVDAEIRLVSAVFDARAAAQARTVAAARVELERLAQSLRDWGATVSTRVVWAAPACDGILDAVREWSADLLVLGVHEHGLPRARLTDTDWQLMRLCPCPLLLVKGPTFAGYRTILAAVDPLCSAEMTGIDEAVLVVAQRVESAFASELRVVHAFPDFPEDMETPHRRAVEELVGRSGNHAAAADVRAGEPAEVINEIAGERSAQLVVLGALQRSGGLAAVLGSTAEAVAAEVSCDVLFVPPPRGA